MYSFDCPNVVTKTERNKNIIHSISYRSIPTRPKTNLTALWYNYLNKIIEYY